MISNGVSKSYSWNGQNQQFGELRMLPKQNELILGTLVHETVRARTKRTIYNVA